MTALSRRRASALAHRELIAKLAVRHQLPAVYGFRYYVAIGGLVP